MHKNFNLFVHLDAVKSVAGEDGDWIFEGIASTADEDLYGEVVYPDSFINSIEFFKTNGKIFFNHEYAQKNADWLKDHGFTQEQILSLKLPIGRPLDAEIRDEGLYIKAALNKSHPLSPMIWNSFMQNKEQNFSDTMGLSIGAKYLGTPRREYDMGRGKYITYLPELLLYEVSVTPEPVNPKTRTWAYAMKSMLNDTSADDQETAYHTIVPDSVLFDSNKNQLVVKSTVHGDSGKVHVFESYINIKEDIEYLMADKKKVLKATPELDEDTLVGADEGELQADESELQSDEAELGADAGDLAGDAADMDSDVEGLGDPMEDAMGDEGDEAVDNLLDSLVGDDSGGEQQEDEAQSMILDKLDSILDALQTIVDGGGGQEVFGTEDELTDEVPGESQVSETPPVIKSSVVELSDESTEKFGAAIKGILEGWEDRVVAKIINKLTNETTVVKSVVNKSPEPRVVKPGVAVDSSTETTSEIVQKSVVNSKEGELNPEQLDTLKSFISEYVAIKGYSQAHSQKRGRVLSKAENLLGISQPKFYQYVNKYENNNL